MPRSHRGERGGRRWEGWEGRGGEGWEGARVARRGRRGQEVAGGEGRGRGACHLAPSVDVGGQLVHVDAAPEPLGVHLELGRQLLDLRAHGAVAELVEVARQLVAPVAQPERV